MQKILAELNKKKIFHVIESASSVKVLTQPAQLTDPEKKMLQKFFGFDSFNVPASKTQDVLKKAEELIVTRGDDAIRFKQEDKAQRKQVEDKAAKNHKEARVVKDKELSRKSVVDKKAK